MRNQGLYPNAEHNVDAEIERDQAMELGADPVMRWLFPNRDIRDLFINRTPIGILKSLLRGILATDSFLLGSLGLFHRKIIEEELTQYTDIFNNKLWIPSVAALILALPLMAARMNERGDGLEPDKLSTLTGVMLSCISMQSFFKTREDELPIVRTYNWGFTIGVSILSLYLLVKLAEACIAHRDNLQFTITDSEIEPTPANTFNDRMEAIKQSIKELQEKNPNEIVGRKLTKLDRLVDDFETTHCGLSLGIPDDPITLPESGHTYGREEFKKYLKFNKATCPKTGSALSASRKELPKISFALRNMFATTIEKYENKLERVKAMAEQKQNTSTQPEAEQRKNVSRI